MSLFRTFKQMEKLFIIVCICVAVFESIGARAVAFGFSPFIHFLPGASTGAHFLIVLANTCLTNVKIGIEGAF